MLDWILPYTRMAIKEGKTPLNYYFSCNYSVEKQKCKMLGIIVPDILHLFPKPFVAHEDLTKDPSNPSLGPNPLFDTRWYPRKSIYLSNVPMSNTPMARCVVYSKKKNFRLSNQRAHLWLWQTIRSIDDNPTRRSTSAWLSSKIFGIFCRTVRTIRLYKVTTLRFRRIMAMTSNEKRTW